jgi:hypothetical protein
MAKRDAFIEDFKELLESIPDNYSLPQWQFAYRQVLYAMGMKILENFPTDAVGPDPSGVRAPGAGPAVSPGKTGVVSIAGGGGQTGGGHPSIFICEFACLVLGLPTVAKPRRPGPPPQGPE